MEKEIIDRLEFVDWAKSDSEHEIWKDPVTGKKYLVEVEITRNFEKASEYDRT